MSRGDYCGRCGQRFQEGDYVIPNVQRVDRVHPGGIIFDAPASPVHVTCPTTDLDMEDR